jgi:hypothetical protein
MKRVHVHGAACLAVGLFLLGCDGGTSPVQPTPAPPPATPPAPPAEFAFAGNVDDTAARPLGGARVEVLTGPRAGTVATTDEAGRFRMPGAFSGTISAVASKDGYLAETRTLPPPRIVIPSGSTMGTTFELAPLIPILDIAGTYTLTLTADRGCTGLSDDRRTRSYTATIVPGHKPTVFAGRLSDARIELGGLEIRMAGDFAHVSLGFVERVDETTYLAVDGLTQGAFGPSGLTRSLNAATIYCPSPPIWSSGEYWWCSRDLSVQTGIECNSAGHQLELVRR